MRIKHVDKSILLALSRGDHKAFGLVYKLFSKPLYKRLLYLLKDEEDTEEVLQGVFVKVWIKRDTIDTDKDFYSYLLRMAHSLAIDYMRRNIRKQAAYEQLLQNTSIFSESLEDKYVEKEGWRILEDAVEQLPPQRKLIFTLCKIEGKSYDEVSRELGISPSTISNQLVLAMKHVKSFASKYNKEIKAIFLLILYKS